MTDIKTLIIETANRRDWTFAQNFNGRAYALMDANWIGYFDELDDVIEFLGISVETDKAESEDKGMNEKYSETCEPKYSENCTCREIVTKERLYERLNDAIRQSEILIIKEEARLNTLIHTKRNLDEYFEDLDRK